jgi:hypothetical protein
MSTLDSMLERNKDFAARQSAAGTLMPSLPRALPNVKAIIGGCADMFQTHSDAMRVILVRFSAILARCPRPRFCDRQVVKGA